MIAALHKNKNSAGTMWVHDFEPFVPKVSKLELILSQHSTLDKNNFTFWLIFILAPGWLRRCFVGLHNF